MTLDLEVALAPGAVSGPRGFIATMIAIAIRDGADHLFLEPDPTPGVHGAISQIRVSGKQHSLVPPPRKHLSAIGWGLRQHTERVGCDYGIDARWLRVRLAGHEFGVCVVIAASGNAERISVCLPLHLELSQAASDLLSMCTNSSGLIEFDDEDFEKKI